MIKAFTRAEIEELGDDQFGTERDCVILSYQHYIMGGRSVVRIGDECYDLRADNLYTKNKRTGRSQIIPRLELDKLPRSVSFQKSLNFFASKPEQTHKVS